MKGPTLITGAAGFAGSHLVDRLAGTTEVVAWCRPGGTEQRSVAGVRWQGVNLLDAGSVAAAMRALRPSRVFHCAGAAHVGQSWSTTTPTLATNVLGTHHVVEALRAHAPQAKLLIPSTGLVYAPADHAISESDPVQPTSPYAVSKLAQELVGVGNDAPQVYLARPFNHFGPRQSPTFATASFARRIAEIEAGRSSRDLKVGNLETRRDLTDVRDTVRAYELIVEQGVVGRVYNVCTGRAVAVRTMLDMLIARARVAVNVVTDPALYRPNDQPLVQGDSTRLRTELGWAPTIPLEQTLDDLLEYWRDRVRAT